MKYEEFIKHVEAFGQFDSRDEAETAVKVTLETLKERIVGNEASQLAAQLPEEIAKHLRGREGERGDHFKIEEFYQRICNKANIQPEQAANYARSVFAVLSTAVTPGEFADVKANLSEDYGELFAASANV
jgi:uncharacterized protein (DUF2267 family)